MAKRKIYSYAGVEYGSINKARWAGFLDLIGVEYEANPYKYIDFKVKCYGTRGEYDDDPFDLYISVCGMDKIEKNDLVRIFSFYGDDAENKYSKYLRQREIRQRNPEMYQRIVDKIRVEMEYDPVTDKVLPEDIPFPVLVVGLIPYVPSENSDFDVFDQMKQDDCGEKLYVPRYDYDMIDGDEFGAWPCAKYGKFFLLGADSSYMDGAWVTVDALKAVNKWYPKPLPRQNERLSPIKYD